jgi:predicted small lipoprotein YifL
MRNRMPLWVLTATAVLALLASGGCGVRGSLDAPPRDVSDMPPPTRPGEPPPHKPTILDPLIR